MERPKGTRGERRGRGSPGGRALERLREFERARGLPARVGPREAADVAGGSRRGKRGKGRRKTSGLGG